MNGYTHVLMDIWMVEWIYEEMMCMYEWIHTYINGYMDGGMDI